MKSWFLKWSVVGLCLGVFHYGWEDAKARASYCYTSPSYSGYASYAYSQPYYSYYPKYVAYPVASYVGIPIPIFGSVYVGPGGATNITTTATRTTTATSTQTAATGATAVVGGGATTSAEGEILTAIKTLTALVGQVAQKQESQSSVLLALQRDHSDLKARFLAVEAKVNGMPGPGGPPAPVAPPAPAPKKDGGSEAAMPAFYQTKCFSCHQEGAAGIAKDKKKQPIILFTKAGKRAALLVDVEKGVDVPQAFLNHITDGTMPPPSSKIPALTPAEQTEGVLDVKNFLRRKS
jgi:hypothetical protein